MQKSRSVSQKVTYWLKVVSLGLILGIGLQFVQAWTAPPAGVTPPNGNVEGPVTVGDASQYKTGYLGVGTNLEPNYPLVVGGDAMVSGKVYSSSTTATDLGSTLTTKDYVDGKVGGGGCSRFGSTTQTLPASRSGTNSRVNLGVDFKMAAAQALWPNGKFDCSAGVIGKEGNNVVVQVRSNTEPNCYLAISFCY